MLGPDSDLDTLIANKDHLNVLRAIRAKQLRKPDLVIEHGKALLGDELKRRLSDESARLSVIEQMCLAALDIQDHILAETSLTRLKETVGNEAIRFRMLLARCLEAADDKEGASKIYNDVLKTHPSNLMALKRLYCLASNPIERMEKLNHYLQQSMADPAGWWEMAQLRKSLGDWKGAAFALEEVVLACPMDDNAHCCLAEAYATEGGIENLKLARKHMAQALELNKGNLRAMFGLVSVANNYLEESSSLGKKQSVDEHDVEVAKELVKYGVDKIVRQYKGTKMFGTVQQVMKSYTEGI